MGTYMVTFVGMLVVFFGALWSMSNAEGRKQLRAGLWIIPCVVLCTFLSYYGDNGPDKVFGYGSDVLIVVAAAVGTYYWSVREGFRTPELEQVVRTTLADADAEAGAVASAVAG
jgi:hypothetical protein